MSIKARSAIGLAGHDADFGHLVRRARRLGNLDVPSPSSRLPWVVGVRQRQPGRARRRQDLGAHAAGRSLQYGRRRAGRSAGRRLDDRRFRIRSAPPAIAAYYAHWLTSPFADDYLEQMAEGGDRRACKLGHGRTAPTSSASASRRSISVGHAYGPRSHEVQDVLVRLDVDDRQAARPSSTRRSAPATTCWRLSADHGVADIPEQDRERRPPADSKPCAGRHRDGVETGATATARLRRGDRRPRHLPASPASTIGCKTRPATRWPRSRRR